MSDGTTADGPPPPQAPINHPVSVASINALGIFYLIFAALLLYVLVATWPVLEAPAEGEKTVKAFQRFVLFGSSLQWAPDRQVLATVITAGALGSLIHALTSFADFVGNQRLSRDWIWWLILRVPIGVALAVLFYFVIRGGLIVPNGQVQGNQSTSASAEITLQLNLYSIAAFSALAGMFSKQATDKFGEIFTAIFAMHKDVKRNGALGDPGLTINPTQLIVGTIQPIAITGSGFDDKTVVSLNGQKRAFAFSDDCHGILTLMPDDVQKAGDLELLITMPGKTPIKRLISVVAAAAAPVPPAIISTDPAQLASTNHTVTLIGSGFVAGSSATVNAQPRQTAVTDLTTLTVTLDAADTATPGDLALMVTTPDKRSSDTYILKVN